MEPIKAPFTPEQVEKLNAFQQEGRFHPFTCGGNGDSCYRKKSYNDRRAGVEIPFTDENEGILIATENGWVCPCGKYTQGWAHGFKSK